jgi:HAD superfamily hydrolase (TIGR01509 family)
MTFLECFHGIQISGDVGIIKPDNAFFHHLMATFGFRPQEALFIDDLEGNILAAQGLGLAAIQFRNPEQLERDIESFGIRMVG